MPEKENQLQTIVKDSGLEPAKATVMLEKFQNYFEIAAEWEQKANAIVVTNAEQTAEMQMAKAGRLFLREKRIAVEKTRKELKEQALREGKAIDGIANVLKALIVPIEEHLKKQEDFVVIREEAEKAKILQEILDKREADRIAQEKAEAEAIAEEQKRIKIENEKLKADAEKREKKILADKKKADAKLATERAKAEAEQAAIRETARIEQEKQQAVLAEQKRLANIERKKQEEIMRKQQAEAEEKQAKIDADKQKAKAEAERLQKILDEQVECPFCHKKFNLK